MFPALEQNLIYQNSTHKGQYDEVLVKLGVTSGIVLCTNASDIFRREPSLHDL